MKKSSSTKSALKAHKTAGDGDKVDLMIKFNPYQVFKVCTACKQDMKLELQRPLALFARNGTDVVCRRCGGEMAPEYARILNEFYNPRYPCNPRNPHNYDNPLEDFRAVDLERTIRLKKQRQKSMIKKIIAKGFTMEDIQLIKAKPDYYARESDKKQRRKALINKIIAKGFTMEDILLIKANPDYYGGF